jgi:hypothetical protein
MKYFFSTIILACSTLLVSAQKIDFDGSSSKGNHLEGYNGWVVTENVSGEKTLDNGVTIKVEAAQGSNPMSSANDEEIRHVKTEWWKQGYNSGNDGAWVLGDALIITGDDHSYVTSGATKLDVTISGLAAGHHSLQAYHNVVEYEESNGAAADIDIYVNGTKVMEGVKQSIRKSKFAEVGQSYIEFDVEEGLPVTISYVSTPKEGVTYGRTYVSINALIFNTVDNSKIALDPIPNTGDLHAGDGAGTITLQWTAPASAKKHHIFLGDDAENLTAYATTTEPTCDVTGLSPMKNYYWRVDEEDASGNINQGDVWLFRPARLAFPGAEGYGRFAIGGRGGTVYHVTTLEDYYYNENDPNDSKNETPIEGSFRYGIKKVSGPRTIVFDVAGVISLKTRLTCSDKFVTIAGQTAPGNGIMFRTCPFGMASDGITRFVRMRLGHKKILSSGRIESSKNEEYYDESERGKTPETTVSGVDGMGMSGNDHAIMDHCSISWTIDEAFSSRNGKGLTLQRTLISEALNEAGHPNYGKGDRHGYAATIGGGEMGGQPGSYHHNLLAHCEGRNWSISGGLDGGGAYDGHHDIYNNVVYNWGGRATDGGTHEMNFCNNYYKMGTNSTSTIMNLQLEGTGTGTQSVYVNGNIRQEKNNGKLTEDKKGTTYKYSTSGGQVVDWDPLPTTPFSFMNPEGNMETAVAAFKNVLSDVGCTQPFFDKHDQRMVSETKAGTTSTKGSRTNRPGLIDSEEDAGCEGFDLEKLGIVNAQRDENWDTDGDGIPDWFEALTGTNPSAANNNEDRDGDYYTDLEEYLNWIAVPNFIIEGEKQVTLKDYFAGYNAPTYSVTTAEGVTATEASGVLTVTPSATASKLFTVKVKATEDGISLERNFNFAYANGVTGIYVIKSNDTDTDKNAPIFDLQGRRITNPTKGLYIQNGKKIVIR